MQKVVLLFLLAAPAFVKSFDLKDTNGTITFKMLSNSTDKSLLIARGTIDAIEDGALCASPFEAINVLWNRAIPHIITKEMFGQCPSLKRLRIDHPNDQYTAHWTFESDAFSRLTNLKDLTLIGADVTEISKSNLVLPRSLMRFKLSKSKSLTSIDLDVFDGLTDLELIWLEQNNITVEGKFDELPKLKEIIFDLNYWSKEFPWEALKNLGNLKIVRLLHADVKVKNIDEVLENVPKLKVLNLGYSGSSDDCKMVQKLDKEFKSTFGRQDVVVKLAMKSAEPWCEAFMPLIAQNEG